MRARMLASILSLCLLAVTGWAAPDDPCLRPPFSPLIVDVKGDGIHLGRAGVGVDFDLFANGSPVHMQWVRAGGDDAFLAIDLNGNGVIDDGSEIFGQGTQIVLTGERARNGFVALQQYDSSALGGNEDGLITPADAVWPMLRVWTDKNADGKSQRGELSRPVAKGLVAFETIPQWRPYTDEAGNVIPVYSWVTRLDGTKVLMVDVFFQVVRD